MYLMDVKYNKIMTNLSVIMPCNFLFLLCQLLDLNNHYILFNFHLQEEKKISSQSNK